MKFCFAFNFCIYQTYMPEEKQDIYAELGYIPLLTLLEKHPKIKASLFIDGLTSKVLFEKFPEIVKRIKKGIREKRYELGTYTYSHPILSHIPYEDTIRQIRKGMEIEATLWQSNSKGIILPEGGWDPSLSKILKDAGVEWALVSPTTYKKDFSEAEAKDMFSAFKLKGIYGSKIKTVCTTGLDESTWRVVEGELYEEEYFKRISRMLEDEVDIVVDKSDAEFIYLALPRLTDTPWGEGNLEKLRPFVEKFNRILERLEGLEEIEFVLVGEYMKKTETEREIALRPGSGWHKNLSQWLQGSEKIGYLTDEVRTEIKIVGYLLMFFEKQERGVKKTKTLLNEAWDKLMEAELSVGRRACAHEAGQVSRVIYSMERAYEARELVREAAEVLAKENSMKKVFS